MVKHALSTLFSLFIPFFLFSQIFTGSKVVNSNLNMEISVTVNVPANEVEVVMTGPVGRYNSYGFGSNRMTNTYVFLTQGNTITERKLGNHSAGVALNNSLISSNYEENAGIATTTITREIDGANNDYFSFPTTASTLTIIWGVGNSNTFVRHSNRGSTTLTLTEQIPCTETTSSITETVCDQRISPSKKYTYTQSGTYKDTIANNLGCDSIITLNLTVNSSTTNSLSLTSCEPVLSPSQSFTLNQTGIFKDTLENSAGCDSILTIDFTLNEVNTQTNTTDSSLISLAENASYQWVNCNANFEFIDGANSKEFVPTKSGNYAVIVTQNNCTDTSACNNIAVASINKLHKNQQEIFMYPNPSKGEIYLEAQYLNKNFQLHIQDLDGKQVFQFSGQQRDATPIQIDVANGVYWVTLTSGKSVLTQKLIINK